MENLENLRQSLVDDITNNVTSDFKNDITKTVTDSIADQLGQIFAWLVVPAIIVTVLIIALYIIRAFRRYRVERAIFEIRDTLREMKRAQSKPAQTALAQATSDDDRSVAQTPASTSASSDETVHD